MGGMLEATDLPKASAATDIILRLRAAKECHLEQTAGSGVRVCRDSELFATFMQVADEITADVELGEVFATLDAVGALVPTSGTRGVGMFFCLLVPELLDI